MNYMILGTILAALGCVTEASPNVDTTIKCPIVLNGLVPKNTPLSTFDTHSSPFNANYTKGQNLTWSQILLFPRVQPSRFDVPSHKALEVTISDKSIFVPGGGSQQLGFRRAGLLLGNGSDESNVGVKTFHWSVKQDPRRKMNLTHEYLNVWHEANDYASNQFSINAGIMLAQDQPIDTNVSTIGLDRRLWKILDRRNNVVWTTRISGDEWQNFGVTLDYGKKYVENLGLQSFCSLRLIAI